MLIKAAICTFYNRYEFLQFHVLDKDGDIEANEL